MGSAHFFISVDNLSFYHDFGLKSSKKECLFFLPEGFVSALKEAKRGACFSL